MKAAASAGLPPAACKLILAKWARTSESCNTSLIALLSLVTMVGGVFGGAAMVFHA
jgi:hypothetical protein